MSNFLLSLATLLKHFESREIFEIPESFDQAVHERWKKTNQAQPVGKKLSVEKAIHQTVDYLLDTQDQSGFWVGELESNVSITCEWMMLMYFMDTVDPDKQRKAANYILKTQLPNGSWRIYSDNPGDLSTTVEAYFCLKMAGYSPDEPFMQKARQFILDHGGMPECRMMTRIWLSMFGQYSLKALPIMPAEFMFFPQWFPLNVYSICSWARTIIVPLLIIFAKKPHKKIPQSMEIKELYPIPMEELAYSLGKAEKFWSWKNFFIWNDKFLRIAEKTILKISRPWALKRAEKWVLKHQLEDGDCAGIFPAMANSALALYLLGYPTDSGPVKKALESIDRFQIEEEDTLRQQSCISPCWDTAWIVYALSTAGFSYGHPQVAKAMDWLLSKQTDIKGDWVLKNPGIEPGGWAFQHHNELNPDTDDTAVVLMALLSDNLKDPHKKKEFRRGLNWLLSMQNKDGGWGAFDVGNDHYILNEFPFSESDNLIDPSTEDVTGRVLEAVGQMGMDRHHPQVAKAVDYLKSMQHSCGGWYGRWGVNYIYGTWSVLPALRSVGEDMGEPYIQQAVHWLKTIQNDDGGWGESCKSYVDKSWIGRGASTASQTAWAVMALVSTKEEESKAVKRGIQFLLSRQKDDGTWDEPEFTGTGFPQFFLIKYHLYRIYFPLLALARYRQVLGERSDE